MIGIIVALSGVLPHRVRSPFEVRLMISLEDCVALSGLTEDQVLAIAEHEHVPEIAAAALSGKFTPGTHSAIWRSVSK